VSGASAFPSLTREGLRPFGLVSARSPEPFSEASLRITLPHRGV
jgi:hypothetical protein